MQNFRALGALPPRPLCLRWLGALPPNPQPLAAGGFAPTLPKQPPHCEFLATRLLPDGDQLTIQHLASLERPAHQKTNLTKLCKNLSKIFDPY